MSENIVLDKTYVFSLKIIEVSRCLSNEAKEYVLSKQLLRDSSLLDTDKANSLLADCD